MPLEARCLFPLLVTATLALHGCSDAPDSDDECEDDEIDTATASDTDADTDADTDGGTGTTNAAPSGVALRIEPASPTMLDDLSCIIVTDAIDPNGDDLTYSYEWTVDGVDAGISEPRVAADDTRGGEEWSCTARANDGELDGIATSTSVSITDEGPCHAIQLTNTDARISVDSSGFGIGSSDWTFEFWVRVDNAFAHGGGSNLFCQNQNYAAYAIRPAYRSDGDSAGRVICNTYNNTSGSHNLDAHSEVIDDGEWHHIACNYEGGTMTVYTDGVGGQVDSGAPEIQATSSMSIGNAAGYGDYGAASVSFGPIRYSSSARYDGGFTPSQDWAVDGQTVAQYLVSDGFDGTTLADEAGGDNDGTHDQGVTAVGACD